MGKRARDRVAERKGGETDRRRDREAERVMDERDGEETLAGISRVFCNRRCLRGINVTNFDDVCAHTRVTRAFADRAGLCWPFFTDRASRAHRSRD